MNTQGDKTSVELGGGRTEAPVVEPKPGDEGYERTLESRRPGVYNWEATYGSDGAKKSLIMMQLAPEGDGGHIKRSESVLTVRPVGEDGEADWSGAEAFSVRLDHLDGDLVKLLGGDPKTLDPQEVAAAFRVIRDTLMEDHILGPDFGMKTFDAILDGDPGLISTLGPDFNPTSYFREQTDLSQNPELQDKMLAAIEAARLQRSAAEPLTEPQAADHLSDIAKQ